MASPKGLGKGLGALLGDELEVSGENTPYKLLPIYRIEPNPEQPRHDFDPEELQALSDSIRIHGIIQPLTVRELNNGFTRSSPASAAGVPPEWHSSVKSRWSSLKRMTKKPVNWRSSKIFSART